MEITKTSKIWNRLKIEEKGHFRSFFWRAALEGLFAIFGTWFQTPPYNPGGLGPTQNLHQCRRASHVSLPLPLVVHRVKKKCLPFVDGRDWSAKTTISKTALNMCVVSFTTCITGDQHTFFMIN